METKREKHENSFHIMDVIMLTTNCSTEDIDDSFILGLVTSSPKDGLFGFSVHRDYWTNFLLNRSKLPQIACIPDRTKLQK